ncbi:MAG: ADP-ribosylglycohydrolase [Parcubacteria group bacterium Gr01-1014_13]|nr:MAG: ADP-ribosylglycohydrolase [Parcubacteria group bacterium Gr01-1014_13]
MRFSNPNMLLYIAMADAYAVAVEYNNALEGKCLEFQGYLAHPTHGLPAGSYTDDTEMSVANALVLIQQPGFFTKLAFADAYVAEFKTGGRRKGYSKGFQTVLELVRSGKELLALIDPTSVKNGAAMRAVPIGVLPTVGKVLEVATLQASITHDTPEGRFSARAVALMSHFALYENTVLPGLGRFCQRYLPEEDVRYFGDAIFRPWPCGPVKASPGTSVAIATVQAVVTVLAQENSLMGILRQVIKWGGDTDSVAAIAWGIASARYHGDKLPSFMERDLEGGSTKTGAARLRKLGELLMYKYQ